MAGKVPGPIMRERGRRIREIWRKRCRRGFAQSQIGTVHGALTLEDGSLVVTENYLKVRIAAGPRAQRVGPRADRRQIIDGELLAG